MAAMQIIAGAPLVEPTLTNRVVSGGVEIIALLLPSLDRMTQTSWLLGASLGDPAIQVFGQTVIYLTLICAAGLFDLYRKNF
jgi:hypothetical protein